MTENKKIAAELVEQEAREIGKDMRDVFPAAEFVSFEDQSTWPDTDGDRCFVPITIGVRGMLTKREARQCAAMWREALRRYPKAYHSIYLLGFNEDPREIWDIPEAACYMLDPPQDTLAALNDTTIAGANVALLAACGVYGDEMKAHVLRGHAPPVVAQ